MLAPLVLLLVQQAPAAPPTPVRPRDPFVFRCVLDKRARMLVAALDEEMWCAWDTTNGSLVKAWKGGVNFDGAVYTTVHGPQPTSRGTDYITGDDGSPWTAYVDGKPVPTKTRYLGYVLNGSVVSLEWGIGFGDREVVVLEMPGFCRLNEWIGFNDLPSSEFGTGAQPALRRTFRALGLRAGEQLNLVLRTDNARFKVAHEFARERTEEVKDEQGRVTAKHARAELPLDAEMPWNWVMLAFDPVVLPAKTEEKK
jgi:hypothetical protein